MQVINLFGGPGSGKSTTAAGVFYFLKMANRKAELVTEYAKDLYYSDVLPIMTPTCQEIIFAEQSHRIERLKGKIDYVITDSPMILGNMYGNTKPTTPLLHRLCLETFLQYDNVNFFIDRPTTFEDGGRMQDLEQSKEIDKKILDALDEYKIYPIRLQADSMLVARILAHLGV